MTSRGRPIRDEGVEWRRDLPQTWETKRLKHVATINDDTLADDEDPLRPMSYVDIGSVDLLAGIGEPQEMVFENAPSRARRLVQDGDTIVSTVRTYLRAIAPIRNPSPEMVVSTGFAVVRPTASDAAYAYWAIREHGFVEEIVARSVGVSYPAINPSEIGAIPVPQPPLAEQRRIASYLDSETARIDRLITMQDSLIERLDEYRTALITRVVTKGLPPEAAEAAGLDPEPALKDSGVEWLGEVPEHWRVSRLKGLLVSNDGGIWGEEPDGSGDTVVLRSTDQAVNGDWSITEPALRQISKSEAKRYRLLRGDLLVTKSSGSALHIGKTSLVTPSVADLTACFSNFMQRLRCGPGLDAALLRYILNAPMGRQQMVFGSNTTTGLANLNGGILANTIVPVAPVAEQSAIVDYLDVETNRIDALRAKAELSIERLSEYRSALISAAVTGKIDVRDSALAGAGGGV